MIATEVFFDLSSPWTCIAFHNFRTWADANGAPVSWRPFLVGGVFNAVNDSVYAARQNADNPKMRLSFVWLKEWAALAGVPMHFPSPYHPVKSVHAMRFCCALEPDQAALLRFAEAAFNAYFTDARNLDDPTVLIAIANEAGLDGAALAERAQTPEIKDRLRANTQEAIDRGAFGSPTFFVGGTYMYFGNDQLPLVQRRISASPS
ncbi:2-hydroxychromene-2-carboxylate isomerase [Sandaracinobacteroides hominis]|uniref:2-hydroxychromene-2-carboxylate isomerase n=1 Tax=Sandaracinobacteroides hominis TaxID=2780086 RepID=UPI0018F54269|nr:2-hydroxychromene-2-carboxylate isomerase [Sandaracinobacteroides hominis]